VRALGLAIVAAAVAFSSGAALACTSFASYGDETYYGMNFDYDAGFPLRIFVDSSEAGPVFHLAFMSGDRPIRTSGMNGRGLMSCIQELYPEERGASSAGPDEIFLWEVYYRALNEFESVDEVNGLLATRRVIQSDRGRNLHVIVADAHGGALVVEPGDDANRVTGIDGGYIVMTNFCVGDLAENRPEEIPGVGIDRYVAARDYLEEHSETLDLEGAFEVLRLTSWDATRASMVYAPERGEVHLALERDFDRIFRISLSAGTVETYPGSDESATWKIGRLGLPTEELRNPDAGFITRLRRLLGI
jgi:hypothetical protein